MSALSVFIPRRFGRLMVSDAMNISRDPILPAAVVLAIVPSLALWLTRDAIDEAALSAFGVEGFARYLAPVALLIPAYLIGWVTGFLLLEDRDDGTLLAVDVTPIGKSGFLAYRVTITVLVTICITLPATRLVIPEHGWAVALVVTFLVAVNAVLAAAILPAVARNKVEGLALTKLTNIASFVPLLAVIPSPWRYLAGFIPSYWIGELLRLSSNYALPLPAIVVLALATHAAAAVAVFWLLGRRAG
jgi:fluoroquinolone transport system permease protein